MNTSLKHDVSHLPKAKRSFRKMIKGLQENTKTTNDYIPSSITFTKLELPILYSNLVLIEDMKFENSNYFLCSNGFISKKIKLSSINHGPFFDMSSCVFRIYPKTYNVNKYKVLDYIQTKCNINEEELHFKFSAEMFNNLDIVQNKFAEPVRYGDIIMLMHENTRMFVKFIPQSKKLTLSNHDSEATLFSVEPASEIMLNDNQILKTGQPIKLKIAWFTYANQNLFFGIRFPYSGDENRKVTEANNDNEEDEKSNKSSIQVDDEGEEEIETEQNYFDTKKKLYLKEPELIVEENSTMKWRMSLYSPFTTDENLIIYGDFVQIYHCNTNSILTVGDIEEVPQDQKMNTIPKSNLQTNEDLINDTNSSFDLNESGISLINNKSLSDIDNEEFQCQACPITAQFFLKQIEGGQSVTQDVNSTWILENIFPSMKKQSFIRYFEDMKLDTYRMAFRIKNFKTNKILTILPVDNADQIESLVSEEDLNKKGYLKGSEANAGKLYKFALVDDKIGNGINSDDSILNEEYQYSLFAFQKTIKSSTFYQSRPEKNDFLRLYHVSTKSYLKIIQSDKISPNPLSVNDLTKCILTLTKYPEEKEVFKLCPVDTNSQWKFRFLNSLYFLLQVINHHLEDSFVPSISNSIKNSISNTSTVKFSTLQMMHFILDKLLKFTMNKFINKFSNECGFNSVVKNRQTLISNFGFTKALFLKFIYNFWLHDGTMDKLNALNNLLFKITSSEEALNSVNNLAKEEKTLYAMYKYTESIFDFSIVYCKDNEEIKNELYEYLYVYFYFINTIESCLFGMIEIFKNNQKILHSLIRDCKQKENFRNALLNIFRSYFPKYISAKNNANVVDTEGNANNSSDVHNSTNNNENNNSKENKEKAENISLIDLIFQFIKISRYVTFPSYNNFAKLHKSQRNCNSISLISRERYFELLISTVRIKDGTNILENQRCIVDKMIINEVDNDDNFILKKFLECDDIIDDYPPCLKELLYNMAEQNPDDNIQRFLSMNENLQIDKLMIDKIGSMAIGNFQLAANMKMIIYLIEFNNQKNKNSDSDEIVKNMRFLEKVREFFRFQKDFFLKTFITPEGEWKIDFLNTPKVNLLISALQFLKVVYENNIIDVKQENNFIVILMRFLTRNFKQFQEKKFSNLIHGEMNKKQMILNDRIIKTEHTQYISIAESWLKVYLVFKNVLTKLIEDENSNAVTNSGQLSSYFSTLKKTVKTNSTAKKLATMKSKGGSSITKALIALKEKNNDTDVLTETGERLLTKKTTHKYLKQTTSVMNLYEEKKKRRKSIEKDEIIEEDNEDSHKSEEEKIEEDFYNDDSLINNNIINNTNENTSKKKLTSNKIVNMFATTIFEKQNTINTDDYNDISKVITSEDEKTHNKNEISKNIINIFKLIIKKNIQILNENFYDYFNELEYEGTTEFDFDDFIEHCVPNMDSGVDSVNKMIRKFCEEKIKSKMKSSVSSQLSNFNLEFDDKKDKNLNFIQNLIIAFNITDDLEMQEALLSLMYNYFNQRKVFFKNVTLFNEHLITFRNIQNNPFNDKIKIKSDFKKFYQSYEKSKHEYSEEDFNAVENFFTLLLKNLIIIFRKILNYWKYEFRTLSLENANKYYTKFEENENLIKEIEKLISSLNSLEIKIIDDKQTFTKEFYLEFIESIVKIFYFVRRNANNSVFTSLLSILNENGVIYNKMYYSLMRDFVHKGDRFASNFNDKFLFFYKKNNKQNNTNTVKPFSAFFKSAQSEPSSQTNRSGKDKTETLIDIKNRFFSCLFLLITFQFVTIPKTNKAIKFAFHLLINEKELMKYDSICSFLLLLYISDLQKQTLTMKYFSILEHIKILNQNECFGDLDTKMNINKVYPRTFSNLYLDIMINVLKYVISKGNIINEANLDEYLVENVLFLIKKSEHNIYFSKDDAIAASSDYDNYNNSKREFLTKLVRIINYFQEIPSLNKIFLIKIDPMIKTNFDNEINQQYGLQDEEENDNLSVNPMHITDYFPKPHQLYYLFASSLITVFDEDTSDTIKAFQSVKFAYELYKYFIFYIIIIDRGYFNGLELYTNEKKEKEQLRSIIEIVLYGDKKDRKEDEKKNDSEDIIHNNSSSTENLNNDIYDFIESNDEKCKNIYDKFICSSLYLLLNSFTYTAITTNGVMNFNEIMQINTGGDNIMQKYTLFSSFNSDEESSNSSSININDSNDEIKDMKQFLTAGKNVQVNYYIQKKLKLLLKEGFFLKKYAYFKAQVKKLNKDKLYMFKKMLYDNKKELNSCAKKESSSLIYYLLVLLSTETKMQYDQIFYTFMNKIVDFIYKSSTRRLSNKNVKLNNYLLFIVKQIIVFYDENEDDLKTSSMRKKSLREIQILIEKTGIIEACLGLVRKHDVPEIKEMLPNIFSMFCKILKKGNLNSQESFYNMFTMKNKFEPVFNFMLELISNKMNYILSNKSKIIRHKKKKISFENKIFFNNAELNLDSKILQFLQLLCENHNRKLQLFLHSQTNFRKSYDLVSQTQHYLTILFNHFEPFLFEPLMKCFDLLIEFIQGPCLENQIAIINSKLLITMNDILKYYIICENNQLCNSFPDVNSFKTYDKKSTMNTNSLSDEIESHVENTFEKMSTQQISLLTFKSSILLLALVESRTKEDPIYAKIKAIVKPEVLRAVCSKIYFEYLQTLIESNELDDYILRLSYFNKAEDVEDAAKSVVFKATSLSKREPTEVDDYLILETGFFLYFLIMYYQDYDNNTTGKSVESKKKTGVFQSVKEYFKDSIFDSLITFLFELGLAILKTLSWIVGFVVYCATLGHVRMFNILRKALKHQKYTDDYCWKFYEKYTESIEILRDEKVFKIYFYLLPFCKSLNKFEKVRFLEGIDRTNSKTKLMDILKFANKLKFELESDYEIKQFTFYIPIFGVIFKSVELWKDMSLLLNAIQNFFNIFAVYKVGTAVTMCIDEDNCAQIEYWTDEKSFFNMTPEDFTHVINVLSVIQICLAVLIFVEFMCRKTPAIFHISEEEVNSRNPSNKTRNFLFIKEFALRFFLNFEILYYCAYVVFACLGTYISDFYFAFLLLEVIQRFKTLRNVLMAIKNPYKELFLTFILWLILIYYFALFGYAFFRSDFPNESDCSSLVRCMSLLFYENNKMDNGIGGYLTSIYELNHSYNPFVGRFWYDELFNLILKILVIQIISGIIIDNFAVLRIKEMEMISDMKNICTICSLKREEIMKIYDKHGKTYSDHIGTDHKIFNYIFYIIYLYKKDTTEFTGIESYVYELAFNQKDITWFPTEKLYIAKEGEILKDEEEEDEEDD